MPLADNTQERSLTTSELQDQMRKDGDDHLICERCGSRVKYGWVYRAGAIVLATCGKKQCQPDSPPWYKGCTFVR